MINAKDNLVKRDSRRAVVLILVLAVLTMLALLAVVYARLAVIERSTSRAYSDLTRARLHAQSGIFFAATKIRALYSDPEGIQKISELRYYGEDLNANGKRDLEVENQDGDGILETYNCPLRWAVRPSFMKDLNEDGKLDENDLIEIKGKKIGLGGYVLGTYRPQGDFYTVRVEDLSSKIYVNLEDTEDDLWVETMFQNLARAAGLNNPKAKAVAKKIYDNRPYFVINELESKAELSKEEFNAMRKFLTVYAWQNKKVVQPVPLSERIGKPKLGQYIYTWEEIRPEKIDYPRNDKGDKVGRAPVNINTAPKEVLIALLAGLKGFYLDEGGLLIPMLSRYHIGILYTYSGDNGSLGKLEETPEITYNPGYLSLAEKIAESIMANREIKEAEKQFDWEGPFTSWKQFNLFCDEVLWQGEGRAPYKGILTAQQASVLKANFNPNSNINDFNPDFHRMFWVDKTDLTYHTTEFIFHPTGYFAIDSIGRVLGKEIEDEFGYAQGSQVLAEAEINTIVKLFEIYHESTQSDFLYDYWKEDVPKDKIISANEGFGATTDELSLQTYPEILDKAYIRDADYDGHISLATVEHRPGAAFIAHYSKENRLKKRLDADSGHRQKKDKRGPYVDRLVRPVEKTGPAGWKPGKLFPDGIYSEIDSVPMYNYRPGNLDCLTVSLWVKPHFFPESAAKVRVYLTFQGPTLFGTDTVGGRVCYVGPAYGIYGIANGEGMTGKGVSYGPLTETLSIGGYTYSKAWDNASFMAGGCGTTESTGYWEGCIATPCLNHIGHGHEYIERPLGVQKWGTLFRAGKWIHIAWVHDVTGNDETHGGYLYDDDEPGHGVDVLFVNGKPCRTFFESGTKDVGQPSWPPYGYKYYANTFLRLGEKKTNPYLNTAPDSTLDEVIIWERATEGEALSIYQEGRYYRENDGVFTSAAIDFIKGEPVGATKGKPTITDPEYTPPQATILLVYWTQYRPDSLLGGQCKIRFADENRKPLADFPEFTEPAGSAVRKTTGEALVVSEPTRYQVIFEPNPELNDVLVDSLIFDDITIIYTLGPPRFLSWVPGYSPDTLYQYERAK